MKNLYTKALNLYEEIDNIIDIHYTTHKKKPPCAKGCASCCSQFFEISELEFLLISETIDGWSKKKKNALALRAKTLFSIFEENWPSFYLDFFTPDTIHILTDDYYNHHERYNVTLPCVFLSNEGLCDIYDKRPLTCRTTGVGFQQLINFGAVCHYIKIGITTPLWQADLRPLSQSIDEVRWLTDSNHPELYKRQYPMFYYAYNMLINNQYPDNSYKLDKTT